MKRKTRQTLYRIILISILPLVLCYAFGDVLKCDALLWIFLIGLAIVGVLMCLVCRCPHCGRGTRTPFAEFCPYCGEKLEK